MALATYSDLKASIAGWLNKQSLAAQIPDFITLAEKDHASLLRDRRMHVTADATSDCGELLLPDDYLEAVDIRMKGARNALRYLPPSEAVPARFAPNYPAGPLIVDQDPVNATIYYALRARNLVLLPTPTDTQAMVTLTYFARPAPLSDAAPVNWILTEEPALYLYGALLHAAPYLVDDDRIPMWGKAFTDRIATLNDNSKKALTSGGVIVRGRRGFG